MFKLKKKLAKRNFSETLCYNYSTIQNKIQYIGLRPISDEEFNYYLAGLIEGDGCISKEKISICFHEDEIELLNYIQNYLNFGVISKIKDKKAYNLYFYKKKEVINIINRINGKIKTEYKYNQLKNLMIYHNMEKDIKNLDITSILNNHWLSGFTDADGSLQLKVIKRKRLDRKNIYNVVKLNYQVSQKERFILEIIKNEIGGGYIGTRKHPNNLITYYYESTSFKNIAKLLIYFDKFHLQSLKYIRYILFKEILNMCNNKEHLTEEGFSKILEYKKKYFETYKKEDKVE